MLINYFAALVPLQVLEPPIPLPTYPEEAYWHERFDSDPAHRWLREIVRRIAQPLGIGGRPQRRSWAAMLNSAQHRLRSGQHRAGRDAASVVGDKEPIMIPSTSPSSTPTTPPQFDARKYKETTREQWQQAAGAWHRHAPTLNAWLGPATERMLDLAGVRSGQRVLDVAAGAGEQTLAIARRVGPGGSVLATDLSPRILELAAAEARRAGLGNVSTQVMDGEQLTLPDASVDVVVSRVGLIYFPDQHRALTEMRRVLVPGGRVAAIVYSTPERNAFFSTPVSIIRRRANLGAPLPGQPGPFSLGGARRARRRLRARRLPRRRRRGRCPRRCASPTPPPASSSSASRSARSTRCSPASTRADARRPGTRSRRRCARSRAPTASRARASW